MGLKHKLQNAPSELSEAIFESHRWTSFVDRHTEDQRFRYATRLAGLAVLGLSGWLGYKGFNTFVVQMEESATSIGTSQYLNIGGMVLGASIGVPLTLFSKCEYAPSFAEQDAIAKELALAAKPLRLDLVGQLSIGPLELEAAMEYYDAAEPHASPQVEQTIAQAIKGL